MTLSSITLNQTAPYSDELYQTALTTAATLMGQINPGKTLTKVGDTIVVNPATPPEDARGFIVWSVTVQFKIEDDVTQG